MSSPLNKLKGQVLLDVALEPGNTGLRFSAASMGVFGAITGSPIEALVGRSVTAVRYVEGHLLQLEFVGDSVMRIDLTGTGPEAFSLSFPGGPIVVG